MTSPTLRHLGLFGTMLLASACSDAAPAAAPAPATPPPAASAPMDPPTPPANGSGGAATTGGGQGAGNEGGANEGGHDEGGSAPIVDQDAPVLVSTEPLFNASGVTADQKIQFRFGEPMDEASVEAAYESQALPLQAVTLTWNDDSTELTVTPNDPLSYAEGLDLSVGAYGFSVAIGVGATDLAGNPLQEPATVTFTTLRRIMHVAPRIDALTGHIASIGTSADTLLVGDRGLLNSSYRSLLGFDLSGVPIDYVAIESAKLTCDEEEILGAPDDAFGTMVVHQVGHNAVDLDGYSAEIMGFTDMNRLLLPFPIPNRRVADVTAIVQDDLDNRIARADRSRYRLQYAQATDDDNVTDAVRLDPEESNLHVTFLID